MIALDLTPRVVLVQLVVLGAALAMLWLGYFPHAPERVVLALWAWWMVKEVA